VRAASVANIITKMDLFRERASAADVLLLGVREGGGLTNFDRKTARDTFFEQDEKWNYIHHKVYEDFHF
jgi:hypothetical protein